MFEQLEKMRRRPRPFERMTIPELWSDPHISKKMLELHLDERVELASRSRSFIAEASAHIIERFAIGEGKSVCDFGCGPGLYTTPLAESGASVTGIDFSRRSIRYAREVADERGLAIDYRLADYLEVELEPRYDLVTMIFWDFCAMSPAQRQTLLSRMRAALAPGGQLLLDVLSERHYERIEERHGYEAHPGEGFWTPEPHHVFSSTFKYEDEKLILDKYTVIERERTREVLCWLTTFTPERLCAELDQAGLEVAQVLGKVTGEAYDEESVEFAVIARSRG